MDYKLFINGGYVRDELMGIPSNDMDYTVVIQNIDNYDSAQQAYDLFVRHIKDEGLEVFLETPDKFTVRAKDKDGVVKDFVLSRKESGFIEGARSPSEVQLGTLYDDGIRRDFTVNSLFREVMPDGSFGEIIDYFDGVQSIKDGELRTPLSAEVSFTDDPLRVIRAFRFTATKNLYMSEEVTESIRNMDLERFKKVVSAERIYEEIKKMFAFDGIVALDVLKDIERINWDLYYYIFKESGLNLMPKLTIDN